jgi:hypothetical protein
VSTVAEGVEVPTGRGHEPLHVGKRTFSFLPHHIHCVGPRMFLVIEDDRSAVHEAITLSPDEARRLAERLKIAACQAEAMERKAQRRAGDPK